jgi:hypothetical protein
MSGAEAGVFEAFYAGPVQHPLLLWAAAALALAASLTRRGLHPSVRRYCAALALVSFLDAWLTAHRVFGMGTLPAPFAGAVPLGFVLLGDYRYLLLWEAATADGRLALRLRGLAVAAALTLIVPIASQLVLAALPAAQREPRVLYFVYELAFVGFTAALCCWHPRAREVPWLRSVSAFVMIYYALWATADAILLATDSDFGFALRIVPNLLYYGGLIAAIAHLAPAADAADQSGT